MFKFERSNDAVELIQRSLIFVLQQKERNTSEKLKMHHRSILHTYIHSCEYTCILARSELKCRC